MIMTLVPTTPKYEAPIEFTQRAFDGKWVCWRYMLDPTEDPSDWQDREMLFPKRWVQVGVYDFMVELE